MKKLLKPLLIAAGLAGTTYLGIRLYWIIRDVIRLDKALTAHLNELAGDDLKLNCHLQIQGKTVITISINAPADALERLGDAETLVMDYIRENFTNLLKYTIRVKLKPLAPPDDPSMGTGYSEPDEG